MLFLTESDVRELLPMAVAVDLMEAMFHRLAAGESQNQPRHRLILPAGSVLHYMAGADGAYFGAKIYSTHARHGAHFLFLLYDAAISAPLAMLEANHLGQIRTGAASDGCIDKRVIWIFCTEDLDHRGQAISFARAGMPGFRSPQGPLRLTVNRSRQATAPP